MEVLLLEALYANSECPWRRGGVIDVWGWVLPVAAAQVCNNKASRRMPGVLSGCPHVTASSHLIINSIQLMQQHLGCVATNDHFAQSDSYSFIYDRLFTSTQVEKNALHVLLPVKWVFLFSAVLLNYSQMPDKLHIFTFSPEPGTFYARYMVWSAFPTRANVNQTLNQPLSKQFTSSEQRGRRFIGSIRLEACCWNRCFCTWLSRLTFRKAV